MSTTTKAKSTTGKAAKVTRAQIRRLTAQLERQLSVSWVRVDARTLQLRGIERSRREARARKTPGERVLRIGLRVNRVPV
ncbi:hypothetical protein [Gemmatimonas sp.]